MSNHSTSGLPLFEWVPPRRVLVFPIERRAGKIRRVAEVLSTKSGNDAASYYGRQIRLLADNLLKHGYAPSEIERQIGAFHDAVQREVAQQSVVGIDSQGHNTGDWGDAS